MSRRKLHRYFRHGMLPQLIVFEAVARLGGATRAAEALCLAQPTVSTHLRKLSDALGVRLFEARGRRLAPTEAGRALHEGCAELLGALGRLEERLAPWRGCTISPPGARLDAAAGAANNPFPVATKGRGANGNPA